MRRPRAGVHAAMYTATYLRVRRCLLFSRSDHRTSRLTLEVLQSCSSLYGWMDVFCGG